MTPAARSSAIAPSSSSATRPSIQGARVSGGKRGRDFPAGRGPRGTRMEMEAALDLEDLLHSFVSAGFGGRPEDTVARTATVGRRPRLGAELEMEDLIHNVRVELNRKEKEKSLTTLGHISG
ncbi:uncharacterized protein LOC124707508 [Lolium rigidum]|uniref:uncharacterized protein LOC124707508 n=1 Tax=Lolium rigidum TaxID=89674 RepID=UPI001F5CA7E8|nr:uncharacterized protein LOC124707508 [Lolium rigidum]